MVPVMVASSGITLLALPELKVATVTTKVSLGLTFLDTIDCKFCIKDEVHKITQSLMALQHGNPFHLF